MMILYDVRNDDINVSINRKLFVKLRYCIW